MLKRLRNKKVSNFFLIALVVCLFVLSKQKNRVNVKPIPAAPLMAASEIPQTSLAPLIPLVPIEPEPLPRRVFSRQLNVRKMVARKAARVSVKAKKKIRQVRTRENLKLNGIVEAGLTESPQGWVFNLDRYESLTALDPHFALDASIPREIPVTLQESTVVASDLTPYHEDFKQFGAVPMLAQLPQEKTLEVALTEAPATENEESPAVGEDKDGEEPGTVTESVTTQTEDLAEAEPEHAEPTESAEPELVAPAPQSTYQTQVLSAVPAEVSAVLDQSKKALKSIQNALTPEPKKEAAVSVMTTQKKSPNRNAVPGVEPTLVRSSETVGNVYGKLTFDSDLQRWLDAEKGHVELRLSPVKSTDPQDTIFVDYQFPERDFSWDGREISGEYQLIASFFMPNHSVAVAQVVYSEPLQAQSAKQMVVFHIKKVQLDEAVRFARAQIKAGVVLSGTVFEANTADHKDSKTIPGAEVEVVGFPQWGKFKADGEGSFRIPQVVSQSEFILSVAAPGYYPTQVTVPVFETTGYVSVHLIPKNTVHTVTRYFTQRPQAEEKAVLWGKVFNPETRAPQAEQEIYLSGRSGRPLYFGTLPDKNLKSTTTTGSFAFFNVEPTFRSVGKKSSSTYDLIQTLPGYGYYVELGRSGKNLLRGSLFDPYRQHAVVGRVKVVGSPHQVDTDSHGNFELSSIELPSGLLTIEVEAEGYPLSWHTIPWRANEQHRPVVFYLPESDLVEVAQSTVAKMQSVPHTGALLGGAEPRFFGERKQCVYVSLETFDGRPVSSEQGPYPLNRGTYNPAKPLCLSKYRPGFSFFNLEPNQYVLKWRSATGELLRAHVARVGADRVSVLVN